jgi:formylglycine-generating enzyme required for sulfatase activity
MLISTRSFLRLLLFPSLLLLAARCSWIGSEREWNNPYDPTGTRYSETPVIGSLPGDTAIPINDTLEMAFTASSKNAQIKEYLWSFDGGNTFIPTVDGKYAKSWQVGDTGIHTVYINAMNEWGMKSENKTFSVTVKSCYPHLATAVSDTPVSQFSRIERSFSATDSNGRITAYLWGTGTEGWDDSLSGDSGVTATFENPDGGTLMVRWAARDDDGLLVIDTFNIIFNRRPDSAWVASPSVTSAAPFQTFDIINGFGQIVCSFKAHDPDQSDTLTYSFFCGLTPEDTVMFYNGTDSTVTIDSVLPLTKYQWILRAEDIFGDSIVTSGNFTTAAPPSAPEGMVLLRSSCFQMGQSGFNPAEEPIHPVCISTHLWIDSTEVTFAAFKTITGVDLANGASADMPVSNVSWYDAALYCNARSRADGKDTVYAYTAQTGETGKQCTLEGITINSAAVGYRLPTEAEWELACRGDSLSLFFWGNDRVAAATYAWTKESSGGIVHAVAGKKPTSSRLYDMAGNVGEWCQDWFDAAYYTSSTPVDPQGPPTGTVKSIRGGSFKHSLYFAQAGTRSSMAPQSGDPAVGFRTVLTVK